MTKLLYFDYAALIMDIVLLFCILLRRMVNGKMNRIFLFVVCTATLTCALDILAVQYDNTGMYYYTEKMIFHSAYLMMRAFTSVILLNYIIALTDTWFKFEKSMVKRTAIYLPVLILAAMIIANIFTGKMFYIDSEGNYIRGSSFIALYIVSAYYTMYGFSKIFRERKLLEQGKAISLYAGFMIVIVSAGIQFVYPKLLVDMFSSSVSILFIFMMVQRPEENIDGETGLLRLGTYDSNISRSFKNKKPETIIMVKIANADTINNMLGYRDNVNFKKALSDQIIRKLKNEKIPADVYCTGPGDIRIKLERRYRKSSPELAEYFNSKWKQPFEYNGLSINIIPCICIVNIPDDIDNMGSLVFLGEILNTMHSGNVIYASELKNRINNDTVKDLDMIIESAIALDRFEVYYQPIYSVKEKRFNSAEALLRLKDPKYGFVSPELFIPAAEKTGAIHKIGNIVMETVCRFVGSEVFKELGIDYLEVNLSPVQCLENDLAQNIIDTLKNNKVLPEQINLEITETAADELQSTIIENIDDLHNAGLTFSLDDFGTGYSNMTRIASLPFRIIKLDRSFVALNDSPNYSIVVENLVKMIKSLNLKIVVEGVETAETVNVFSELGCDYIQGYYYSRPLPRNEFVSFIRSHAQAV